MNPLQAWQLQFPPTSSHGARCAVRQQQAKQLWPGTPRTINRSEDDVQVEGREGRAENNTNFQRLLNLIPNLTKFNHNQVTENRVRQQNNHTLKSVRWSTPKMFGQSGTTLSAALLLLAFGIALVPDVSRRSPMHCNGRMDCTPAPRCTMAVPRHHSPIVFGCHPLQASADLRKPLSDAEIDRLAAEWDKVLFATNSRSCLAAVSPLVAHTLHSRVNE